MEPRQCLAEYDLTFLESRDVVKPSSTVPLRIPCLGRDCDPSASLLWHCSTCKSVPHVSHSHQYIYCDCGRCPYSDWTFRCTHDNHGPEFQKFKLHELLPLLEDIQPAEELNILILGRTGVGKSTWINAFVNYLLHESLDDALQAEKLSWVIPFAFRIYTANEQGDFEDFKIEVGFNKTASGQGSPSQKVSVQEKEHDGSDGGSATQKTVVHRVSVGKQLIRLIDTPGIGDTRGADKDKENLADILSVLRSYEHIHGILILLKPNEQRLDIMFKFCIQELLTHLHRDAAKNIAFGFTNTRGTNYAPGDSFDPLRQLLGRLDEINIPLPKDNVYCFDSESFRFLAAQKMHGKVIGYHQENKASWDYSVAEARRLLDHFRKLPAHQVTSTVNLYETRHRITAMTRPMADIAEAIRSSILVNEDRINELKTNAMKKKDLEKTLKIQVKTLRAKLMDRPRTTCSHADCISHDATGLQGVDGKDTLRTVYNSVCHNDCYLEDVTLD